MTAKWIDLSTIINIEESIMALNMKKISFLVDGLFYPDQSYLIVAYIIITIDQTKLESVDFISLIALPYRNAYSAELCRALVIIKIVEYLIL